MSGGTTDTGTKSSSEMEREVESTRAQLTGTLEELRDKASPGQLFEQALGYARDSGGADFARNLGQQVRDNPLPLLLIGAGIGWLMLSDNRPGASRPAASAEPRGAQPATAYLGQPYPASAPPRPSIARVYGGAQQESTGEMAGPSLADRAGDLADEAKDRIGGVVGGLRDSLSGAAGRAGDMGDSAFQSVASAGTAVAEGADAVAARARMAANDARDGVGELADSARQGLGWLLREQPLVLGAIGLAVGAAVGAVLPGTSTENRLMGETRDDLVEKSAATAQAGYERVKEAAGEHLGQAKERLGDGAPSADRMGDAVGGAARTAREAVSDLVRNVAGEAKDALDPGDGAANRPGEPAAPPRQPDSPKVGATPNPGRTGPL